MNIKSFTLYSVALLGVEYLLFGVFGLFILVGPGFVSIVDASAPKQEDLWAPVYISKPGTVATQVPIEPPSDASSPTEPADPAVDIIDDAPVVSEEPLAESQQLNDGRWIDVNLSEQQIYAYEGDVLVNSFLVS